ncbi:uncharacterized protein LOC126252623 [Schistocerca nitens]|uniref:uncharacterized protein LOC126252623 n=1 Tax=Schistocerca nitens TaxID=7011 RepID=UPI0021189714|nr:uncharacterized protein LOC126252623 [Schistocerca nitens]
MGFSMVNKPSKILSPKAVKSVHQQTTAEKEETVVIAANAMGQTVPPMFIFKGIRVTNSLKENVPPLSQVAVSENGWINLEIFLEYLKHFIYHIPPTRPVLLMMDSHSSHVSPEALKFRQENGIIFVAFPSHTT